MNDITTKLLLAFENSTTDSIGHGLHVLLSNSLELYNQLLNNAILSYSDSRDTLQNMLGIMSRMEYEYLQLQYVTLLTNFETTFNKISINDSKDEEWKEYIHVPFDEKQVRTVLQKAYDSNPSRTFSIIGNTTEVADALSKDERRALASFVVESVQRYGEQLEWGKETVENQIFNICFLRSITLKDDILPLFYLTSYNVLDRLCTSELKQIGRDLSEGVLMCSYDDNLLVSGYLGMTRTYIACNNALAGLLYANLMLRSLDSNRTSSNRELFEIVWTLLKLFREYNHVPSESYDLLVRCFKSLRVGPYEHHSFYHSYFCAKALEDIKSDRLQNEIADYLNCNREDILSHGGHSAIPWYTLIASIEQYRVLIPDLKWYSNTFKMMLDSKGNSVVTDLFENKNLSIHLKEFLYRLEETRNLDDYSKDIKLALSLAKRLLTVAAETENLEDFVLAMRPKTDYTFVKKEIRADSLIKQLDITEVHPDKIHIPYLKEEILNNLLCTDPNDCILWLGRGSDATYLLTHVRDMNRFQKLNGWGGQYNQGIPNEKVLFAPSIKKKGEPVYYKDVQDYYNEYKHLLEDLSQYSIEIPNIIERAFFVKDIEYCGYPTNLIVEARTDRFIGELMPTANVISTELLISTNCNDNLKEDFSKTFWMPEEAGDMTFYNIREHVGEALSSYGFNIRTEIEPNEPISSDLNIICAHGGADISLEKYLSTDDYQLKTPNRIIGNGKVLIMFVCYSGTIKYVDYDNAMHSFIKTYLQKGYDSVIAPMWTLATDIIPIWLPVFMKNLQAGEQIVDSVYQANMAVKENYQTPNAWACLHLFGNPYVRVVKK